MKKLLAFAIGMLLSMAASAEYVVLEIHGADHECYPSYDNAVLPYRFDTNFEECQAALNKSHNALSALHLGEAWDALGVKEEAVRVWMSASPVLCGTAEHLGYALLNGEGTGKNYLAASSYYRSASRCGISSAMNNLGVMYEQGRGVKMNLMKAYTLYVMCTNVPGHSDQCTKNVNLLERRLTTDQVNEAQALAQRKAVPSN